MDIVNQHTPSVNVLTVGRYIVIMGVTVKRERSMSNNDLYCSTCKSHHHPIECPKEDSVVNKEWPCPHIKYSKAYGFYLKQDYDYIESIPDDWDICPVKKCGATRPEKKELWEKLHEYGLKFAFKKQFLTEHEAKDLAKIAEEHFKNET